MRREIEKRLDVLEQRKAHRTYADNLGAFYALPDDEKARRVAHMYPDELETTRRANEVEPS